MNKSFLLVVFYLLFSTTETKAQNFFKEEYPGVWERATDYTIGVAEVMPESFYNHKVHPEGMSFKEQQLHVVNNISFLSKLITDENKEFYNKNEINALNKKQITEILNNAFRDVAALIDIIEPAKLSHKIMFNGKEISLENIFYLIRDHVTHHRAQSIIYLRMKNIKAPEYVGW